MAGRKTILNSTVQKTIVKLVRKGVPLRYAAEGSGVGESTLYLWFEKGKRGLKPYREFLESVEKAKKDLIEFCMDKINTAAIKQWQAAAWLMERKYPEDFGRMIQEHKGEIRNEYIVAIRAAENVKELETIHRTIQSVTKTVRLPGGNGSSGQ